MRTLLYIPGWGDAQTIERQRKVVAGWNRSGVVAHIFDSQWISEETCAEKQMRLLNWFDAHAVGEVTVIGTSAGGPLAILLLKQRSEQIKLVKIVCGKLRGADGIGPKYTSQSASLKECVMACENSLDSLAADDSQKIITYRPLLDEVVPLRDMTVSGARNKRLLLVGHVITIGFSLLFLLKKQ